jgi:putative hemolysin
MDSSIYWVLLLTLVISAMSSGLEIAYVTANKLKIELDRKQGIFSAGIIAHFVKHPKIFIATMLVGNNIALVVFGLYMGELLTFLFHEQLPLFAHSLGTFGELIVQTLISTFVVLIFGEFIPKAIFSINPNRWLNLFALPLLVWYVVLWVFAFIVNGIAGLFLRLVKGNNNAVQEVSFGRTDLDHYLQEATGNVDRFQDIDHEIQIFQNALDFRNVKARDCLIPRNEIVGLDVRDHIEVMRSKFIETRLSKILVYKDNIDHIIGYVHSYDLFRRPANIQSVLRPVAIVPEPMTANEILELFIREKKNMAVVVDEYGGTAGIITMEDIVEEIIGEIEDEHDKEELEEEMLSETEYRFSARFEIDYLNEKYNLQLPENEDDYDTLGGLILHLHGDIPEEGQEIDHESFIFKPLKVSENRIELVLVTLKQ